MPCIAPEGACERPRITAVCDLPRGSVRPAWNAALGTGLRRYDGLGRGALADAHRRRDGQSRPCRSQPPQPDRRARCTPAEPATFAIAAQDACRARAQ